MDRYIVMLSCSSCTTGTDFKKENDEEAVRSFDDMIASYNRDRVFIVEAHLTNTRTGKIVKEFSSSS